MGGVIVSAVFVNMYAIANGINVHFYSKKQFSPDVNSVLVKTLHFLPLGDSVKLQFTPWTLASIMCFAVYFLKAGS